GVLQAHHADPSVVEVGHGQRLGHRCAFSVSVVREPLDESATSGLRRGAGAEGRPRPSDNVWLWPTGCQAGRGCGRSGAPARPSGAAAALDDAASVLDVSLAQTRPRFFAWIGGSGLEIGVLGDALMASHDVNVAVASGAATILERQTVRWVGEFVGFSPHA